MKLLFAVSLLIVFMIVAIRYIYRTRILHRGLRESESRYRAVIQQSAEAIFLICLQSKHVIEANDTFMQLTGYGPDDLPGLTLYDFVDHARKDVDDKIRGILSGGKRFLGERRYLTKDGRRVLMEVNVHVITSGGVDVMCVVARDVTARRKADGELMRYQDELRALASRFALAEEGERRRIAVGLHDTTLQTAAAVQIQLARLKARLPAGDEQAILAEARALVDNIIRETRTLVFELSPPALYESGLVAAIAWLAERFHETTGETCHVRLPDEELGLGREIKVVLYQALCELLANARKHAPGETVDVALRKINGRVSLTVTDSGPGFDPESLGPYSTHEGGLGLFNIRERLDMMGGCIRFRCKKGGGTIIELEVPARLEPASGVADRAEA